MFGCKPKYAYLLLQIMIARNTDTSWFGKQLVKLVQHTDHFLDCPMNKKYADRINQANELVLNQMRAERDTAIVKWQASKQRGAQPELKELRYIKLHFKNRQYATFPAL